MPAVRSIVNRRSATFVSALLLSTAFAAPAYAIEMVIVTAEKKAEDIQTVPISVTAFSPKDLQAKQITEYKDLQFNMPSLTYTNGSLGSPNIAIRGIGSAAVSLSGDSGIAFNENDIYTDSSSGAQTDTYYDIERLEVLRGPQSTLYGRNATGGSINLVTTKPDLDNFMVSGEATYGNYNDEEIRAVVNVPIIDGKLGLRIAGFGELRDGDRKNIYPGLVNHLGVHKPTGSIDSRDAFSGRGSLRWQPTDDTTVDLVFEHSQEADSRALSTVAGCVRDPSGVFGCLPTGIALQPVNNNAVITNTFTSDIGPAGGTALQLTQVGQPGPLSLGGLGQVASTNFDNVVTDFQPFLDTFYNKAQVILHQKLSDTLTLDVHADYENDRRSAYTGTIGTQGDSLVFDPANPVATAANHSTGLQNFVLAVPLAGCPFALSTTQRVVAFQEILHCTAPADFAAAGYGGGLGLLPISGPFNFGIAGAGTNPPAFYSDHLTAFNGQNSGSQQNSVEARIASNFSGPLNFLIAAYHLHVSSFYNFVISANSVDLISVIAGAGPGSAVCNAEFGAGAGTAYPCMLGPSNYNNNNGYTLDTNAAFAEIYYDIIPDELKFTGGARLTSDNKTAFSQNAFINCLYNPLAFPNNTALGQFITTPACVGTVPSSTTNQSGNFSAMTGRAVIDWTPKLDFTDQTLLYASYSRGYRAGGFNPAAQGGQVVNFSQTFRPESIDALEFGTKNTLLDGTLQANLDFWYYDYKNYQVAATINKTAINANINSQLWGAEGEFLWAPDEHWTLGFNFSATDSSIGPQLVVDPRNPSQDAPNVAVVKDYQGANCVIINTLGNGAPSPVAGPGLYTDGGALAGILVPAAVNSIPGVAAGVSYVNGSGLNGTSCSTGPTGLQAKLDALYGGPLLDPLVVSNGISEQLSGKKMPNTPPIGFGVNVQYLMGLGGGYTLVPRVDYYFKGADFYDYHNGLEDRIGAWDETNAQIQLNAPDSMWYARAWVKNAFDKKNLTGGGAGDQSQGLFNGLQTEPPRTYGISLGAHF